MTLGEELAEKVYATMPAAMPCNSVLAIALIREALERAAQECEKEERWAKDADFTVSWRESAIRCAERIRALKGSPTTVLSEHAHL